MIRPKITERDKDLAKIKRLLRQAASLGHKVEIPPADFLREAVKYWDGENVWRKPAQELKPEDFDSVKITVLRFKADVIGEPA